jgi:hypothetical protein
MIVHYHDPTHQYTLEKDGALVEVPSITQCTGLLDNFRGIDPEVLQAAAVRGRDVHYACELYDKNDLLAVAPELEGYLECWKQFRKYYRAAPIDIELICGSWSVKVAGRLDRVFHFPGGLSVIEIKTCPPSPVHGVQTAGQAICLGETRAVPRSKITRHAVYLNKDGVFVPRRDFVRHNNAGDYPMFFSCVAIQTWRMHQWR